MSSFSFARRPALGFGRVALAARDAGDDLELPAIPIAGVADLGKLLLAARPKE